MGAPPTPRALQPTVDADSKTDGSVATATFRYEDLRQQVALSQLRMLGERLRFLYLRLGRADQSRDPTQQNPDLIDLLAGLQWIQDLLGGHDAPVNAAFRDSWDGAICFLRGGTCLRYDAATRKPLGPPVSSIKDDWPGLWPAGDFGPVSLARLQMVFGAARGDCRLRMLAVPDVSHLPATGDKELFQLALVGSKLHIRIFAWDGHPAVDWAEGDAASVDAVNAAIAVIPPRALPANDWKVPGQTSTLAAGDRNALVQRLGALTNRPDSFRKLGDEALIGVAAIAAFLLAAGIYDRAWFKGKDDDYLRNELIVQNGKHTGRTDLQAMTNQQLVGLTFEWFDWAQRVAASGDALKQLFAVIPPRVLLAGDWKVPGQTYALAVREKSALVQRLGALTNRPDSFGKLGDEALIGVAAIAAFLLAAGIYDRAWFKGKDDDYLRNELIVQNGRHTGRTDLQAMSNQQLVGLGLEWFDLLAWQDDALNALKQRFAVMPGVLLVGDWKTPSQTHPLSAEDRAALLEQLGALTNQPDYFRNLSDQELVDRAAVAAFLLASGIFDRAWFKGKDGEYLRNELIVQNGKHTGRSGLQGMTNRQLVGVGLEWFDWPKQRFGALPGDDQRAIIGQICTFLANLQLSAACQGGRDRGRAARTAPIPLWNGVDMVVNATNEGEQGFLFKDHNYYEYALGTHGFTKIEGPSPIGEDFPGLWLEDVVAASTGVPDRVLLFQKQGTYDNHYQYHPPRYMIYNFDTRAIEPGYPKDIAGDWPGLMGDDVGFSGADRGMAAILLRTANSLYRKLSYELDYFGNTSTSAILGTDQDFDKWKKEALGDLKSAENEYRKYQSAMNQSAQSTAGLQLAVRVTHTRLDSIEDAANKALASAQTALAKINRLRGLLDAKGQALATDAGDLKDQVRSAWGVSWQDLFGCLTQFSFMHWANLPEKVESGPVLMAAGQAGDLLQKGISNVVSDSGQSMNKTYVVRRVDSLTKEVRSLKDLTLTRGKFIDPSNLYNDAYKLTVTRDQFKELCNDFTRSFPAAEKIIKDLDEYVTLADQRNAAVLDYNELWQRVGDLQAERAKDELDYQHAQSSLAGEAQPNLPVFTSFATEVYNRAKDQTLQIYYWASRAYIMKSLEVRDKFSEMLSALPAIGQIDAATFTQASLEQLYDKIIHELKSTGPTGPGAAHIVFRKDTHPKMFAALARDGVATFPIQQATSKSTTGPFARMANVRLTRVRCWAGGLKPGEKHTFTLVHTGHETLVKSTGEEVTVDHDPKTLDYAYIANSEIDPTLSQFKFQGDEWPMVLTDKWALMGPFTTWNILVNKEDGAKATSLRVEFDVVHQAFTPPPPH